MTTDVSESITVGAPADLLYDLVADVDRMGEWSPEATGARRAGKDLKVGDRFVGLNKRGPIRWFTVCTIRAADRGALLEFDVDLGPLPISTWRYDFERLDDRSTRVVETWIDRRDGIRGSLIKAGGQLLIPGPRDDHNRANIKVTLQRLKAAAESIAAS